MEWFVIVLRVYKEKWKYCLGIVKKDVQNFVTQMPVNLKNLKAIP